MTPALPRAITRLSFNSLSLRTLMPHGLSVFTKSKLSHPFGSRWSLKCVAAKNSSEMPQVSRGDLIITRLWRGNCVHSTRIVTLPTYLRTNCRLKKVRHAIYQQPRVIPGDRYYGLLCIDTFRLCKRLLKNACFSHTQRSCHHHVRVHCRQSLRRRRAFSFADPWAPHTDNTSRLRRSRDDDSCWCNLLFRQLRLQYTCDQSVNKEITFEFFLSGEKTASTVGCSGGCCHLKPMVTEGRQA